MSQNLSSTAVVIGALRLSEYKTKKEKWKKSSQHAKSKVWTKNKKSRDI